MKVSSVLEETQVPRRWRSERLKFVIKQVGKGLIFTLKSEVDFLSVSLSSEGMKAFWFVFVYIGAGGVMRLVERW